MVKLADHDLIGKLPIGELKEAVRVFLEPVTTRLPEKRLRRVGELAVQGILAARSPLITKMAGGVEGEEGRVLPVARRVYRFLWNNRFTHRDLLKGLYGIAQRVVGQHRPDHLVVAIDPVNFEKPYTRKLDGVSTVMKSTPPGPKGEKRLTSGYPAITATVVNLSEPVITYAQWFSYRSEDFISENWEIYRAIRTTRALFPDETLRFVTDAGLDDRKIFKWLGQVRAEFVIRVSHRERRVEIYNPHLNRWEEEALGDLADVNPETCRWRVKFSHAHKTRWAQVRVGWFPIRLLDPPKVPVWVLVIEDPDLDRQLILLTNVPIDDEPTARMVYSDWRMRPQIEHTYRFDQERGLDVEDMCVRTLERLRRLFVLVLLATLFVYHIGQTWPRPAVIWLLNLGGKLGLPLDADGPYILLAGIAAVFMAARTFTHVCHHPFPRPGMICG
jgi:hypothetical protein